jgi:hypothetical protein
MEPNFPEAADIPWQLARYPVGNNSAGRRKVSGPIPNCWEKLQRAYIAILMPQLCDPVVFRSVAPVMMNNVPVTRNITQVNNFRLRRVMNKMISMLLVISGIDIMTRR